MATWVLAVAIGLVAGAVASWVMNLYQGATKKAFPCRRNGGFHHDLA